MTGFGRSDGTTENRSFSVEVKTLNSKQTDIILRIPAEFKNLEMPLRKELSERLKRGKIECIVQVKNEATRNLSELNHKALNKYHNDLKSFADQHGLNKDALLALLLKMPEAVVYPEDEPGAAEHELCNALLQDAIEACLKYRQEEGVLLEKDLKERTDSILYLLDQVNPFEAERMNKVRDRITQAVSGLKEVAEVDQNRFEQELIYYIEKLDFSEEKVRLKAHCDYFLETMANESPNGKKLGFISQEMGREINTLGSKANHAEIQRIVVQMKDELEKIKEQVLNVL